MSSFRAACVAAAVMALVQGAATPARAIAFPAEFNATMARSTDDGVVFETCALSLSTAYNATFCDYTGYVIAPTWELEDFGSGRAFIVLQVDSGGDVQCFEYPVDFPSLAAVTPQLAAFAYNGTAVLDGGRYVTKWVLRGASGAVSEAYYADAALLPVAWRREAVEWRNYTGVTLVPAGARGWAHTFTPPDVPCPPGAAGAVWSPHRG